MADGLRGALHRTRDRVVGVDSPLVDGVIGAGYSLLASIAERRRVRVRKSDGVWAHEWGDEVFLSELPVRRPVSPIEQIHALHVYAYRPQRGDTVVDCGAGVGSEVAQFSRAVGPTGRVVAIEAHPLAATLCQRTVDRLGLDNVTVLNAAVMDRAGEVIISDGGAAIGNMIRDADGIPVRGDTLADLLAEIGISEVDYLKANIEGAERPLLQGLDGRDLPVRHMCVSCHDFVGGEWFTTFAWTKDWLARHGYDVTTHPVVPGAPYAQFYVYGDLCVSG